VGFVLFRLPVPKGLQVLLVSVVLVAYAGASGLNMAVIRALIMGCVVLAAPLFRREPDGLSAMGLAGIVGLLIDPAEIIGVGFWLSFSAAGALIAFSDRDGEERWIDGVIPWIRAQLGSHTAATLATLPIVALVFGKVPLLGIATTLAASPLCLGLMGASLVAWLIGFVHLPLAQWVLAEAIEPLVGAILAIFHFFGQPWSVLSSPPVPWWLMAAWYGSASMFAVRKLRKPPKQLNPAAAREVHSESPA
jgi:competence protein ComEC